MKKNRIENILAFVFFGFFLVLGYQSLIVPEEENLPEERLEISFLDVGQGDVALIKAPTGEDILIDGGPDKAIIEELGESLPIFDKKIEAIILTHPHADHLAGLNYVLDRYQVDKIYFSGVSHNTPDFITFLEKIQTKKIPTERLYYDKKITYGELLFKVLWPNKDNLISRDLNETSIIVDVSYRSSAFLFLGDASAETQDGIMGRLKNHYDVVKVSHHGSKTGMSDSLLSKTKPDYATISVGAKNYFGHPAKHTLSQLAGIKTLRTDQSGTITFWADGGNVFLK